MIKMHHAMIFLRYNIHMMYSLFIGFDRVKYFIQCLQKYLTKKEENYFRKTKYNYTFSNDKNKPSTMLKILKIQ